MRRALAITVLALGTSFLMAENPEASAEKKAEARPEMTQKPAEERPEGMLFRSLGGEKFTRKTGVKLDYFMEIGVSTNSTIKGNALNGNANGPVASPPDANVVTIERWEQFVHKDIKGNIIPRTTTTPAPMYKKFDWGFMSDTLYGRQANACRMTGFDRDWTTNQADMTKDSANRNTFLCESNAYLQMYLPIFQGVAITAGRFADNVMIDEIPPIFSNGPNFFYTHSYQFFRSGQVFGGMISANLYRSRAHGYLMGEFGIHNGVSTMYSMSGKRNYDYALRYRTPKMDTWIDYTGRIGYGNVKANAGCSLTSCTTPVKALWVSDNLPNFHVFSPDPQMMFENALTVQHEFRPKWKVVAAMQYGKQFGDGKSSTIATFSPAGLGVCRIPTAAIPTHQPYCQAGFTGAFFMSENATISYKVNNQLSAAFRMEHFRNPQGFFLEPMAAVVTEGTSLPALWNGVKGNFNDLTWGINYNPNKYVRIRPELRYDWQGGHYINKAFGQNNTNGKRSGSQMTAAMDMVLFF